MVENIIRVFIFLSLCTVIESCDPGYTCLIKNQTQSKLNVYINHDSSDIRHHPPGYRELIVLPDDSVTFFSYVGFGPTINSFPYNKLVVIKELDTILILVNKQEIINYLKAPQGSRRYSLVIHR